MSGAISRMMTRKGRDWTYETVSEGALNTYRRSMKTRDAALTVRAIRTETAKERASITVRGEERTVDAQLIILDSVDLSAVEDTTQVAPVFTSPSGVEYDAIALGREGEIVGFRRVFLTKRRAQ